MTIDELYKAWFLYKSTRIKISSLATYEQVYRLYVAPYFRGHDIQQGVSNKEMNKFVNHLLTERQLNRKSAHDAQIVLSNMLKYGAMEHDIPLHTYMIEYPTTAKQEKKGIHFFTKDQCKTVFQAMEADPSSELLGIVIGLTTGMRIGEIVGLRFSDVDLGSKTISVNRTIQRIFIGDSGLRSGLSGLEVISQSADRRTAVVVNPPKTSSSRRMCPLAALPLKWLRAYRKTSTPNRYIVGMKSKPIEPRCYREYYYRKLEELGLPRLNPHCMRHTFATQMLHSGADPATIASILGHSSPAITLEIYSHTDEDEKRKQVNAVFGKMFRT